eukprot:6941532-Prymnesium_polylepis.1
MRTDVRRHPSAALVCALSSKAWTCSASGRSQRPRIVGRRSDCSECFVESVPADYNAHNYVHP